MFYCEQYTMALHASVIGQYRVNGKQIEETNVQDRSKVSIINLHHGPATGALM